MSYKFYNSYLTIATTPFEGYSENLQAMIDAQFDNSSSIYDLQEEDSFGSFTFSDVTYRIVQGISSLTGVKLGDDFRKIIYPNTASAKPLGWRYNFSDKYWIVANTDNYQQVTTSANLRKCNNVAKFYDSNGVLREEPCVIDYQLNETAPDYNKILSLPEGTIFMFMQYNNKTVEILENRRFLIGSKGVYNAYKVNGNKNFIDENLVWFTLYRDQIDEVADDLVNGIANAYGINYALELDTSDFEQVVGYTTKLDYTIKLNDNIVTRDVVWSSSDELIGTIDAFGNIELLGLGDVTFTCSMADNSNVFDSVVVSAVIAPTGIIEVRFEPNKTSILSSEGAIEYTVYKYLDDVVQPDGFSFALSGANSLNYTYTNIDANTFSIESISLDYTKLQVTATSLIDSSVGTIQIQLKNLF